MRTILLDKLICLDCKSGSIREAGDKLICEKCGKSIPINDGIPDFLFGYQIGEIEWRKTNSTAESYESTIRSIPKYRLKRIDDPILKYAKGEVLEIGCGTCRLADRVIMNGGVYFGIDPLMSFLKYANKNKNLGSLVLGQGERLPFANEQFDCLISGYYSYRYVNPKLGFFEARRVLRKGGIFAFDILNHWFLKSTKFINLLFRRKRTIHKFSIRQDDPDIFEFLSVSQIRNFAEINKFKVEKIISSAEVPYFHSLDKYLSKVYLKNYAVYLGYDIIIILRAI